MGLVKCKECKKPISRTAKICPFCGKDQRSWAARHKFLVVIIVIVIFISLFTNFCSNFFKGFKEGFNKKEESYIENTYETANSASYHEQLIFNWIRKKYDDAYIKKTNEIQKSDIFNSAEKESFKFLNKYNLHFTNWVGEITEIETDKGGEKLFLTVSSNLKGQKINYTTSNCPFGCGIEKKDNVYDQVRNLYEGQKVFFSGNFIKNENEKLDELSITERGSIFLPEYKINFTNIRPFTINELNNDTLSKIIVEESFNKLLNKKEFTDEVCAADNIVVGDLNNDGKKDGIVDYSCVSKMGGNAILESGWAVFINNNGKLNLLLINRNFRSTPQKILKDGTIISLLSDYGPNDLTCCPSIKSQLKVRLINDSLKILQKKPLK